MSQQLQLFAPLSLDEFQDIADAPDTLLEEHTRQLFQHHGSDSELIERIIAAAEAINQLCATSAA